MAESSSPPPRENRSTTPISEAFRDYIQTGWAEHTAEPASPLPHVPFVQARREAVSNAFPGTTLIIPAGSTKVRSNDTDYPYRPQTAFTYLTGWGSGTIPGSILLVHSSLSSMGRVDGGADAVIDATLNAMDRAFAACR